MLRGVLVIFLMVISFFGHAQRYARANGTWANPIWASTPGGVAGSAASPTATDDVYTNGFLVTVAANATCRNLFITFNQANALTINSLRTLTVTGTLNGYDDVNTIEEIPTASVLVFGGGGSSIVFTAANIQPTYDPYVIFFWDNTIPLGRVTFNLGGLSKNIIIPLAISSIMRIQSGSLTADPGSDLSGNSTATLQIDAGASLITDDPLTNFNNYQISGTLQTSSTVSAAGGAGSLTVNSGGVLNSSGTISTTATTIAGTINASNALNASGTFQMNAGGVLNSSFSGGSQTEGWWSNNNRPTTVTLDPASTINYSGPSQNIYTRSYTNLTLSGSGTKTVAGSGSMNVSGNFAFANSGITCSSSFPVIFDGSGAQAFSGGGTANFNGGLQVNKSAGTLTISHNVTIQNGLTITSGAVDLGSNTINLSGNFVNNGSFTSAAGTLNVTGNSTFSGLPITLDNLTISGTGNLTAPATLNVRGNFQNNGTFNANGGTLVFNGSSPQTISGSTVTNFYDLTTSNTVSLSSAQNLTGILTVSSGTLTTNNNLTLVSNASSDAMIGNSAGTVSGNVTVQKYLNNTVKSYRYLTSPVVGATAAAWKATFPITGTFNDPSTQAEWPAISGLVQASPSMFSYNESAGGALGARFASFPANGTSSGSATLTSGLGYAAFMRQTSPVILSVNGTVRQGTNVQVTLTNTNGDPTDDGWNLIGNPFPAPITWSTVTIPPNVSATMSLKDNNGILVSPGSYVTCAGGTCIPGSFNGVIPIGQAFWVRRTSVGSGPITFSESNKSTVRNPTFLRTETMANLLRAKLAGNGKEDELVIRLVNGALDGVDDKFDGFKLKNDNLSFSSLSADGQKMAINGAAPMSQGKFRKTFPLVVEGNGSWTPVGNFRISFSELETFDNVVIMLKDLLLKDSVELSSQRLEYAFTSTADPKTFSNRFELIIARPSVTTAVEDAFPSDRISIYPNPTNSVVQIEVSKDFAGSVKVLSSIGQELGAIALENNGELLKGSFDLSSQAAGFYFIRVVEGTKVYAKKVIKR